MKIFKKKRRSLQDIPLAEYVVFCIKLLIIFTLITLVLAIFGILVPDTLINCFFAAFGGEFLICGLIKVFKIRSKDTESIIDEGSVSAIGFEVDPPIEEVEEEINQTIIGFKN